MKTRNLIIFALLCGLVVGSIDSISMRFKLDQTERQLTAQLKVNDVLQLKYDTLNRDVVAGTCLLRSQLGE